MLPKQLEALIRRVREVLESGLSIAVVGWRDSNHSEFTRQLSAGKKIFFLDAATTSIPERAGLVLSTRFVTHSEFNRLRKGKPHHSVPIDPGRIKKILEACKDLLTPAPRSSPDAGIAAPETAPPAQEPSDDVLDFLTTPSRKENEMSNIERFTQAFLKAAAENGKKVVGTRTLGKLRKQCSVGTVVQLLHKGLIEPVPEEGKKIGWYKAGPKMFPNSSEETEPTNVYELAKFLVAQKDKVLAEKAEIEKRLARIETAEKVLQQLEQLKKPETPPE